MTILNHATSEQTETLRCLTCGAINRAAPGPTKCGACGGLEMKWLTWGEWSMDERTERWRKA